MGRERLCENFRNTFLILTDKMASTEVAPIPNSEPAPIPEPTADEPVKDVVETPVAEEAVDASKEEIVTEKTNGHSEDAPKAEEEKAAEEPAAEEPAADPEPVTDDASNGKVADKEVEEPAKKKRKSIQAKTDVRRRSSGRLENFAAGKSLPKEISSDNLHGLKKSAKK